ncbi:MAG: peptidase S41 [Lewinellaceae bacterium]|nr:peptidase S41 [Lewinellaceae bacterium]
MKKGILLILTIFLTYLANAQNCSCEDNFIWLKETFEKNDAGFQFSVDKKGEQEYQKHSDSYAQKVKSITSKQECAETLQQWLRFFREGHLSLQLNGNTTSSTPEKFDSEKVKEQFNSWPTYPYKKVQFDAYISKLTEPGLEGIWSDPPYKFGIKKVADQYIGFILEADGVYWRQSQIKFRISEDNDSLSAVYYMRNHSERNFENVELVGKNHLQIGFVTLKRIAPEFKANEQDINIERQLRFQSTSAPLFEKLTDNTVILRIPSFSYSEKELIDSLIDLHFQEIISTENLIIDLRNNGGGSDASFEQILPLTYTNPIRTVGVEFLSTPLNNQRMLDFMNDPDWTTEDKKWAEESLRKLNQHIGEFVNLDSTAVTIETFDTIYPYPKNVGIIINEGNGSTTEQFLLAAKQSKKVKLFGTTTAGVLDISNMYFTDSPCEDFKLGYSLSKSMRIPEMSIDNKGIQPDYYLDETISKFDWISFVISILNEIK